MAAPGNDADVLRLYVEALSRLAARADFNTAKAHTQLEVELGGDEGLKHWWLNEPIGHLLKRAVGAISPERRHEVSAELLRFPLAAERGAGARSHDWYDPGPNYRFIHRSGNEEIFDNRVAVFLQHLLSPGGPSRSEAAVRLLYLHEKGQLTVSQTSSFADALWKDVPEDDSALPEGTSLLLHAFLIAPAPSNIDVRTRLYAQLFARGSGADPEHLVAAASRRTPYLQPNEADAARIFDNVANWRPKDTTADPIDDAFARPVREKSDRLMVSILGIVAAPALAHHDRTVQRAEIVLNFLEKTNIPEALSALPVFYGLNEDIDKRIVNIFRQKLAIGDRHVTPAAVDALDRWLRLSEAGRAVPLPNLLRDRVLQALERGRTGGLAHLIYLARRLIEMDRCDSPELERIVEVLDELRSATDYGQPDGDADIESDRAISLPLVRAECVRLAYTLEQKGVMTELVRAWIEMAIRDPLPEVRHATHDLIS